MTVYFLVVIYNKSIVQSKTIECMNILEKDFGNLSVVVFDNSDVPFYENEKFCIENNWRYYSLSENVGLSKAYNIVIRDICLKSDNKHDVVVLLDDDTNISCRYYEALLHTMANSLIDVATPYIKDQNGIIISPNDAGFIKNKFIKSKEEVYKIRKFNAINSCTAIRLRVFENYSYDESLFLDSVDTKFFEDQRKLNRKFEVLDCEIEHNIQLNSESDIEKVLNRYRIRIQDFKAYCIANNHSSVAGFTKALAWSLLELYRHRNLKLSISILKLWLCVR